MVTFLLTCWAFSQISFLAPYKRVLVPLYIWHVLSAVVLVFLNLFALFYGVARRLFLKDTGRKLAHVDRQLHTTDTIVRDLSDRLAEEE
jgi:presenilin-like A22 family membrane protease